MSTGSPSSLGISFGGGLDISFRLVLSASWLSTDALSPQANPAQKQANGTKLFRMILGRIFAPFFITMAAYIVLNLQTVVNVGYTLVLV
ncbi:MAG: hypothetical protein KTR25_13115 [Myxococcales bacterium]|nr:hypothetical protein [Myxococcales bacterium]